MAVHFDEKWLANYCARTGQKIPELRQNRSQTFESADVEKPKRRKYGNRPTERGGRVFDSQHEADVYDELMLRVRGCELLGVFCQVSFR